MSAVFPRHFAYRFEQLRGADLDDALETVPSEIRGQVRYLVEVYLPIQRQLAENARRVRERRSLAERVEHLRRRQRERNHHR